MSIYQYDEGKDLEIYSYISRLQDEEREEKELEKKGYYKQEPFIWTDEMEEELRLFLKKDNENKNYHKGAM